MKRRRRRFSNVGACICAKVGKVTDDGRLQLFHQAAKWLADMPVTALVDDCPVYDKPSQVPAYYVQNGTIDTTRYAEVTDLDGCAEESAWLRRRLQARNGYTTNMTTWFARARRFGRARMRRS